MNKRQMVFGIALAVAGAAQAQQGQSDEEVQREIEALKEQNRQIEERLDAAMDRMDEQSDKQPGPKQRVHLGGYGELHYNNWKNQTPGGEDKKEIDFHRFVLFFGYDFTDRIRFHSELELEHALAGDGANGEIELEQAYVEFDVDRRHSVKGGLFLVPVGILNETHEPPTFYGVERNPVEKNIIPTTWWECGGAATGRYGHGISADLAVHSGLKASAAKDYAVRGGRQKCSEASAENLATTARLKWTGVPGLEVAATVQRQDDITQSEDPTAGAATLFEGHVVWTWRGLGLRALYANWNLDGAGPAAVGADRQRGWYVEPAYRINRKFGVFARYNVWDNQAGDAVDSEFTQAEVGLNYWPIEDVVIKFDYQDQDVPAGENEFDGFNLGIGYQF